MISRWNQAAATAGRAIEADGGAVVADVDDDVAHDLLEVDPGRGGDFAGNNGNTGLDQGFAGHTGELVLGDDGVQDRVRNLVGDLVRMSFRHGLGGEKGIIAHLDGFLKFTDGDVASRPLKMADLDLETVTQAHIEAVPG